ncbi:MAG: hypothetical protein PHI24_11110 [Desulfitobacteriaceae bacterium]|nr:hypothetical protein [Desulfitobacteriaceae bacterium]
MSSTLTGRPFLSYDTVIISGSWWTGNTISFRTIWFSLYTIEYNLYDDAGNNVLHKLVDFLEENKYDAICYAEVRR